MINDAGEISIKAYHDRYFVNDKLVRLNNADASGASSIISEWETLGVGGVTFGIAISHEEVEKLLKFISAIKPNSQNIESLSMSLKTHQLSNIKLLSLAELNKKSSDLPTDVRRKFRKAARNNFNQAINVVKEAVAMSAIDKEISSSKTKRVVHSLIDHITRDESSLIELTAIKDYDDYTYAHSTNVCVYSLTIGVRLGLDRARLSQLGFAALFHDIGKVKLPHDLIRKVESYDENDWIQMQMHPHLGAKTILRNLPFDAHSARGARGAFEHHINKDFTGYPMLKYKKREPNLFAKIISVVDTFDALTSGRVYIKEAISPEKVLQKMHYQMKVKFDPFILDLFNRIVGIYPPGSLVLLSTDEIALVLTNNESDMSRPHVKIVGNKEGILEKQEWVDLSKDEYQNIKINKMIDPGKYNLSNKDFILGD